MAKNNISRRDALKIMGAGTVSLAAASVMSPIAQAKDIMSSSLFNSPVEPAFTGMAPQQQTKLPFSEKEVYSGPDVVIHQIDEHTWHGNGHLSSNEAIYIVEGKDKALLIDAGTKIDNLDKIVASITKKPVTLVATHVHPDHTGEAIKYFPELWLNAADMVNVPMYMPDYKGKINYLTDGQVFDLGGREIEVVFAPGHTPGSVLFIDKAKKYGFSGDAFGSGYLLLFGNFSTLLATTTRIEAYMKKNGITKMYPGHYMGLNADTPERITNIKTISQQMLDGTRKGEVLKTPNMGLDGQIQEQGMTILYSVETSVK